MIWIAVDAMGGDFAPGPVVDGALAAARRFDLAVALVGPRRSLEPELGRHPDVDPARVRIIESPDVIAMGESPAAALRRKPGASIKVAVDAVKRGEAAALFSAGHTGATVMASYTTFGMLPGVDRPALAATIPTRGRPAILLDVGASVECRPQHLLHFAIMGALYAKVLSGPGNTAAPRVGLLSIGEEATKGNELTREAHRLLKDAPITFIGNIEARDVFSGAADVIVCDGFTGNIALKISEGLIELLTDGRPGAVTPRLDYSEYGGAPLLGLNGVAVVGHGRSSVKAVCNGVATAYRFAAGGFIERLERELE